MEGFFNVYKNPNEDFDIKCDLHPERAKEVVPPEQKKLYVEVESTNNVIKSLKNTQVEIKQKYFDKLLSLAQAGLIGETAQPDLALNSLTKLREEMVLVEGQRIKNSYMVDLGTKALILSVVAVALAIASIATAFCSQISMYLFTAFGAFVGTWVSFGARKFNITFEQLSLLEEDMMSPWIRLIYIGLCSAIFLLMLNTKILSISIGSLSTTAIKDSVELQIMVGVLCGLVESKIGLNLYKKATTFISDSM